ncbi:MAG: hypothetical protein ACO25F_07700 [Erythrobacter sp.]
MTDVTSYEILFIAGAVAALVVLGLVAFTKRPLDHAAMAAALLGGFAGLSAVTIWAEGPLGFVANHSANLWGVQVWYDLVIALSVALVFVAPRARAVGMRVPLYVIATGLLGSIGLLAMVARLFWLERAAATTK